MPVFNRLMALVENVDSMLSPVGHSTRERDDLRYGKHRQVKEKEVLGPHPLLLRKGAVPVL